MLSMRKFVLPPTNENSWSRKSNQSNLREITLNIHWKDGHWRWSSNILVIWYKNMAHWNSPWCWERTKAEGEEDVRGWDGWMTSLMQWTWTWADSGRYWGTGMPGMLQSMGSQRVTHDWVTEQQQMKVTIKSLEKYFPF